ncbi:MAG: HAD family hydrolase [Lachnospiraceae bacterium]|jgi:phosphoglycolate phosphatase|nr:HAD family hydrolase [Lachnospiraceae bacterium]
MPKAIDTIIFDLDGTLLDTLTDLTNSVNDAMGRQGFPTYSEEAVRQMVGNGIYVLMEKAVPGGRACPAFRTCLEDFRNHYEAHKKDNTKPFPGIMDFLGKASKEGYKMAVVSNKFDLAVKGLCRDFFHPYITAAIGESAQIARKPAPDTVFEAMQQLHSAPGQCVYVGDSDVDLATAQNAGIPCISVSWGFRSREFLLGHGASAIAGSTKELWDILNSMA